jgi:2-oxoglutarate ferredoxin oxidoreductase subunit delta
MERAVEWEELPMRYWRKPLDIDQVTVPHGRVVIIADRCKGCAFCVEYCPKDVLVMSEDFNRKGYHPPEVVKDGECVNCNLCEMICPDFAIFCVAADDDEAAATIAAQGVTAEETEGGPN